MLVLTSMDILSKLLEIKAPILKKYQKNKELKVNSHRRSLRKNKRILKLDSLLYLHLKLIKMGLKFLLLFPPFASKVCYFLLFSVEA